MFTVPTTFSFISFLCIVVAGFLYCLYLLPYCYVWLVSPFTIMVITLLIIYSNFIIYLTLLTTYYICPKHVIESLLYTLTKWFRETFPNSIKKVEENIQNTFKIKALHAIPKKCIYSYHPHGIGITSMSVHSVFKLTNFFKDNSKNIVHHTFFYVPVIGDILRFNNTTSSDYQNIRQILQNNSISISIGGVDEMMRSKHKVFELVISKRKGIFRLALETGTPIVPILTYGENEIFDQSKNFLTKYINDFLYEKFRIQIPVPSFDSLKNWYKLYDGPLDPIHSYTGKPIYVKKIENPSEKHIIKLRNIYIQRMKDLFEQTNLYGYKLVII